MSMSHSNSPDILMRLRRAEGHLATVVRMVEEGREGLAIAQQMQAVVKAIEKTKQMLILDHLAYHLGTMTQPLPPEAQARLAEFREITKFL